MLKIKELLNRIERLEELDDPSDRDTLESLYERLDALIWEELDKIKYRVICSGTIGELFRRKAYDIDFIRDWLYDDHDIEISEIIEQDVQENPKDYVDSKDIVIDV